MRSRGEKCMEKYTISPEPNVPAERLLSGTAPVPFCVHRFCLHHCLECVGARIQRDRRVYQVSGFGRTVSMESSSMRLHQHIRRARIATIFAEIISLSMSA